MHLANSSVGVLVYRLYRYRSDFHRIIAARDTTKSRFMRLFVISGIVIIVLVPYSFWVLWLFASQLSEDFSWSIVHGPGWNTVIKMKSMGQVRMDKWGQVAAGYVAFAVFGTGTDAYNTYKRMLCSVGLGKIFPSLYKESRRGSSTSSRPSWLTSVNSKVRTLFSKSDTVTETMKSKSICTNHSMGTDTLVTDTIMLTSPRSGSFQQVTSNDPILQQKGPRDSGSDKSFLSRLFTRRTRSQSILPLFTKKHVDELTVSEKSPADPLSPEGGVYAHAWASDSPSNTHVARGSSDHGVHVVKEVRQEESPSRKKDA